MNLTHSHKLVAMRSWLPGTLTRRALVAALALSFDNLAAILAGC